MANLDEWRIRWLLAGVGCGSFVLLLVLEIVTEEDAISPLDLMVDAVTILLTISAAVGVALLAQRLQAQHGEKMSLLRDLKIARAEGEAWRSRVQSNLQGIRLEMERQFQEWGMTAAERDVGLLILKGLNHKEIAALRGTSEATVRQQAQAIYRKADLPGKTAFSAYFLEDLLAPTPCWTVVPPVLSGQGSRRRNQDGRRTSLCAGLSAGTGSRPSRLSARGARGSPSRRGRAPLTLTGRAPTFEAF